MTDIKHSESQFVKKIQSGKFLDKILGNPDIKVLLDFVFPLAKDVLPKLATKATSSILDKI